MLYVNIEKKLDRYTLKAAFECDHNTLALFGASGAGKSMTLKCIAGIEKPDKGVIQLNGKTLFDSEKKINLPPQKRHVGYLFQDYALFPNMTVSGNITAGLRKLPKAERETKLRELINRFHLDGLEDRKPDTLSGGEKQRVALARIFASSPEVLLLDEPFSSLDTMLKLQLIPYIRGIIADFGGETILVSHDIDEVRQLCHALIPIADGVTADAQDTEEYYITLKEQFENLK
ncbi:MAG: ATP-binding cassette domain-containing protein [Ruminococcus sp.]|uniref:ATP-binding cassette domain-containing protein n=1 Tax=Ruminococcus sp. TaxID=41978 RepID=UPI002873DAC1|nr:ATP-binding cassette domain-containing protein [Ruminococcus sp.]MBQ3285982.1 ATP-binding cassette domain-containing protein [Ruminococcus sp.]